MKLEIRHSGNNVIVPVKVIPGMQVSTFGGVRAGELLFKLAAPPEKGKANGELERFVAELLGISRSSVGIVGGAASRHKKISVPAKALAAIERLAATVIADAAGADAQTAGDTENPSE